MASPTDSNAATTRRGLLAGLAGAVALLAGRRRKGSRESGDRGHGAGNSAKPRGRTPWIGHY
jgi:hypothetical protein